MTTIRVLNFGAGVQSTTLLYMAAEGAIEPFDHVLFADTGWEPAAVYENLQRCKELCQQTGMDFRVVSQGNIKEDLMAAALFGRWSANPPLATRDEDGKRGMLRRKCTKHYKVRPLDREITAIKRQHGFSWRASGDVVEQHLGISTDEAERMKISTRSAVVFRYPLIDLGMSRDDCMRWMADRGHPLPPKSACIGCPYRTPQAWRVMRAVDPVSFDDAVQVDEAIRLGIDGTTARLFIHQHGVPLSEVEPADNIEAVEHYSDYLKYGMINECDGLCGL